MRRIFAGMLCAALLAPAQAEDARSGEPAALAVVPGRHGYAFEQPRLLLRQRLFGLAHGLSLLAAACLDLPEHSGPIQDAYAAWHARQAAAIEILVRDLARHYFGPRAEEAQWPDLTRALALGDGIQPALGDISLGDACASLPQAIVRPRYELDRQLAEADAAAAPDAAPAAAPGPQSGVAATQGEATQSEAAPVSAPRSE